MMGDGVEAGGAIVAVGQPRVRRKAVDVRQSMLTAAREIFETRGYAGATTREIARRADINEVLLFRHFGNKANLFSETVFAPFSDLIRDFYDTDGDKADLLYDSAEDRQLFVKRLIALIEQNRGLLMALVAVHAYETDVGGVPCLEAFFAKSLRRVLNLPGVQTGNTDIRMIDELTRCAFAAVVGATLLDAWIFPAGFARAGERAALLSRFVEFGMYGQPR